MDNAHTAGRDARLELSAGRHDNKLFGSKGIEPGNQVSGQALQSTKLQAWKDMRDP
ncbi:MAG: hypothetical protein QOH16_2157 [Gaiellaceae bacterium]|nr:hypothetical protein [Gaiellaceae bacterium]